MRKVFLLLFAGFSAAVLFSLFAAPPSGGGLAEIRGEFQKKNYLDAFHAAEKFVFSLPPGADAVTAGEAVDIGCRSLGKLGRYEEQAVFIDEVRARFAGNYPVLAATIGKKYPWGYLHGGVFRRGSGFGAGGGARPASVAERDRVEDLRILLSFLPLAEEKKFAPYRDGYYRLLFKTLRGAENMLALHRLTDLGKLPEPQDGFDNGDSRRFPLDQNSDIIFSRPPENFADARSDMERLLFCREKIGRESGEWLDFLRDHFGMTAFEPRRERLSETGEGRKILRNLRDDETLVVIGGVLRKIRLPEDHALLPLAEKMEKYDVLYEEYCARGRLAKAVHAAENALKKQPGDKFWRERFESLAANRGGFEPTTQVASGRAEATLRYRNATSVRISVRPVRLPELIGRIAADLKTVAHDGETRICSPDEIAAVAGEKRYAKFIGGPVKIWERKLSPRPEHEETVEKIKIPVSEPGYYLLKAEFPGGAQSLVPLLIGNIAVNTVFSEGEAKYLLLCDSLIGRPLSGRKVRFFRRSVRYARDAASPVKVDFQELELETDPEGRIRFDRKEMEDAEYLVYTSDGGDQGFCSFFRNALPKRDPGESLLYAIFSQKIYRPGDLVQFVIYARNPDDAESKVPDLKEMNVDILSPRGGKAWSGTLKYDRESGSFQGSWQIPEDAELGYYCLSSCGGGFRVEKFRKPEYTLTVTPQNSPVREGEKLRFTVKGVYGFGAPVVNGKVVYTLRNFAAEPAPFWPTPYRWLYGDDGQLFSSRQEPDRLPVCYGDERQVVCGEGVTGENGEFELVVPTEKSRKAVPLKKTYVLDVVLTDESGVAVEASGAAHALPAGFEAHLRALRGWGRAGKAVDFELAAARPGEGKVSGKAEVRAFLMKFDEKGELVPDRSAAAWTKTMTLKPETARFSAVFDRPGNYLVEAKITDDAGRAAETGYRMMIWEENERASRSRSVAGFEPLEIVTEYLLYRPGDVAHVLVAVQKPGMTVYWRRTGKNGNDQDGIYERLELGEATAAVLDLKLKKEDRPNFSVAAFAVHENRFYQADKDVFMPPEDKALHVAVTPSRTKAGPGETAKVRIKVTDAAGKPVSGRCTVTAYDKSLDALTEGNDTNIFEFFWGRRRYCFDAVQSSLMTAFFPVPGFPAARSMRKSAAYPAAALAAGKTENLSGASGAENGGVSEYLRKNFADAVLWAGCRKTDKNGELELELKFPDDLTAWRIRCWSVDADARAGEGKSEITVGKPLVARLNIPRFLICGDKVRVSGILHNESEKTFRVKPVLSASGDCVRVLSLPGGGREIAPGGVETFDFELLAVASGKAALRLEAKPENVPFADAVQLTLPVEVRGAPLFRGMSGSIGEMLGSSFVNFTLPAERKSGSARLKVEIFPSLAATLTDLLPYLGAADSGDVFGTVNGFVPALSVKYALSAAGIDMRNIRPAGTPGELLKPYLPNSSGVPVFDGEKMEKVIRTNLKMIEACQNHDGGWGWFGADGGTSFADTSCYVAQSLLAARAAGTTVKQECIDRALEYLLDLAEKLPPEDIFLRAWTFAVLAEAGHYDENILGRAWEERDKLPLFMLAMLGERLRDGEKRVIAGENLRQYLKRDAENGTAHLRVADRTRFRCFWYGDDCVVQSAYLNYLLSVSPQDPAIPMLARYLVENLRLSPSANSPMSLALGVRALARYLQFSGEARRGMTATIYLNGRELKKIDFAPGDVFSGPAAICVDEPELKSGSQVIEIRKNGEGSLYFSASLEYFSLEDAFQSAGRELKLSRRYFKIEKTGVPKPVFELGEWREKTAPEEKRIELVPGSSVKPGDVIEVELYGEAANDYDYVRFADPRPAGMEPEKSRSSYVSYFPLTYAEYHPDRTVFYRRNVSRGKFSMRYRMRAVFDGVFTALPAEATGMYVTHLRSNTCDFLWKIQ